MSQELDSEKIVSDTTENPNLPEGNEGTGSSTKADKKTKSQKAEESPVNDLRAIAQAELDQQAADAKKRSDAAIKEAKARQRERPAKGE